MFDYDEEGILGLFLLIAIMIGVVVLLKLAIIYDCGFIFGIR